MRNRRGNGAVQNRNKGTYLDFRQNCANLHEFSVFCPGACRGMVFGGGITPDLTAPGVTLENVFFYANYSFFLSKLSARSVV